MQCLWEKQTLLKKGINKTIFHVLHLLFQAETGMSEEEQKKLAEQYEEYQKKLEQQREQ